MLACIPQIKHHLGMHSANQASPWHHWSAVVVQLKRLIFIPTMHGFFCKASWEKPHMEKEKNP
jgi:hypothetical protein